jgi:hypothetical protein
LQFDRIRLPPLASAQTINGAGVGVKSEILRGTLIAKANQLIVTMKTKTIIITIICSLSMSAVGQNTGPNGTGTNYFQGTAVDGTGSVNPGDNNNGNIMTNSVNSNNQHRIIEPGLNNLNGGYVRITNEVGSNAITNEFGSRAITNGFDYGGITNGYGPGGITNGFGIGGTNNGYGTGDFIDGTNYDGYTNRYYNHKNPYATDPQVMGNGGLNSTN